MVLETFLTVIVALGPAGYDVRGWYLSPEQMAVTSGVVVHAEIVDIHTTQIVSRVYTDVMCRVLDAIYGDMDGFVLTVRQPGGTYGDITTWAGPMPDWHAGEEWILALSPVSGGGWTVYGIKQGAFQIVNGVATRDFAGITFLVDPPDSVKDGRESIPVPELKQRFRRVHENPKGIDADTKPDRVHTGASSRTSDPESGSTVTEQGREGSGMIHAVAVLLVLMFFLVLPRVRKR